MEAIERFLAVVTGDGSGYGSGYGSGNGSGDGYGEGYGDGYGSGYGSGSGSGSGSGYGDGDGSGDGSGYGSGDGSGYGSGIKCFNGQRLYMIDDIPTIIEQVKGAAARGFILFNDMTLRPCWIARHGNYFAHGDTLKEATHDAIAKWQEDRPLEERIADFVKAHPDPDVPYGDLFVWHHILTGSCELGRREWCKAHGYQPTDKITVRTFIEQTVNDYGGNVIRDLAKEYRIDL